MLEWTVQNVTGWAVAALAGVVGGWLWGRFGASRALRNQRRATEHELQFCRSASDAAAREVRRLKSSLAEAEAARATTLSKLEVAQQTLERRERTIEKLNAEIDDVRTQLGSLNELERRLEDHRAKLGEIDRLRTELERKNRGLVDAETAQAELAECRRRLEELEEAHAMLTETEAGLTAELAHASKALSSLQEELADASSEKNRLDAAVHHMRSHQQGHPLAETMKSRSQLIEALNAALESKQRTIARLRSELEQARRELGASRDGRPRNADPESAT